MLKCRHELWDTLEVCCWGDVQRPPLLFLHGFLGQAQDWEPVAALLSEQYYCIAAQLPGASATDRSRRAIDVPLTFESLTAEIESAVLRKLSQPFGLIGYSMGGRIVCALLAERVNSTATNWQAECAAAVCISSSPGISSAQQRATRLQQDIARTRQIEEEGLPTFLEKWYRASVFSSLVHKPDLLQSLCIRRAASNDTRWAAKVLRELSVATMPDYREVLRQVRQPMLWLAGEQDEKYCDLLKELQTAKSATSQLQTQIISGAGHALHCEVPEVVGETIKQHLMQYL